MADSFMDAIIQLVAKLPKNGPRPPDRSKESPEVRQTTAFGSIENVAEAARLMMNQKVTDRPVVYKDLRPESERRQDRSSIIGKAYEQDKKYFQRLAKQLGVQ